MINCPRCNRIIVDRTQNGGYKIRSRMILLLDGKAVALCPSCRYFVTVPLLIEDDQLQESESQKEKIIVNK